MVKYKYLTKQQNRIIFYGGTIFGGLLYSGCFHWIKHVQWDPFIEGLSYAGAVLLGSTIAFLGGQLFKVKE